MLFKMLTTTILTMVIKLNKKTFVKVNCWIMNKTVCMYMFPGGLYKFYVLIVGFCFMRLCAYLLNFFSLFTIIVQIVFRCFSFFFFFIFLKISLYLSFFHFIILFVTFFPYLIVSY